MTTASPEEPLRLASQGDLEALGLVVGQSNELDVYASLGFADEVQVETAEAAVRSNVDLATVKRWRKGGWVVQVNRETGHNRDQSALLASLFSRTTAVVKRLGSAGLVPENLQLVYIHHQSADFQGHGLGVPEDWVALLARYRGSVSIDQFVVAAQAPAPTEETGAGTSSF